MKPLGYAAGIIIVLRNNEQPVEKRQYCACVNN